MTIDRPQKKVTIIQRVLPHYRIPFFNMLADRLSLSDIALQLIYGQESPGSVPKTMPIDEKWANRISNRYIRLQRLEFVWQPCFSQLQGSSLIIIEQSNRLLINYLLHFFLKARSGKLSYWGHGRNMQASRNSMSNKFKALYSKKVDWWFAYTRGTKKAITNTGFPGERITVVQNSINTDDLIKAKNTFSVEDIQAARRQYGLHNCKVGLYCGGMYKEKRLIFLLDACNRIKQHVPSFQMIFIGGGPDSFIVKQAANEKKWIHYIGPKFGNTKVKYYLMSDIVLNPGAVGLSIIDSFVLECPLITTRMPSYHGPEIEYLRPDVNGILSDNSLEAFSKAAINLLNDDDLFNRLKKGCRKSASNYTMEKMVNNFGNGILDCLQYSK